jgi:hypothetical protein
MCLALVFKVSLHLLVKKLLGMLFRFQAFVKAVFGTHRRRMIDLWRAATPTGKHHRQENEQRVFCPDSSGKLVGKKFSDPHRQSLAVSLDFFR